MSDVCTECHKLYQDTNQFYTHLEEKYTHHVCMDIVDAVRYQIFFQFISGAAYREVMIRRLIDNR